MKRKKPARGNVVVFDEASRVSTAEDLRPADREWATSIVAVSGCSLDEAEKRVRRIRSDPKILAHLREVAARLGPRVVITNIVWSGLSMTDLTVSVVPAPVGTVLRMESQGVALHEETITSDRYARAALRHAVASFELDQVFGQPKTSLALFVTSQGGVR